MTSGNKGDFLLGMLVGASVGAAIALLYAPAPGTDTREQVKSVAGDAVGRANEVASTVKDRATDLTGTVKDRAAGVASAVKDRATDVAAKASDVASSVRGRTQEIAGQAQDAGAQLASQAQETASGLMGGGGNGQELAAEGDNWAAQLPDTGGDQTGHRDQNELQTSDSPDVVADRINNAMQGSGEEAHEIAEDLAQAPSGGGKKKA